MSYRTRTAYDRSMDRYSTLLHEVGPSKLYGNGHFHFPWYVRSVLCADGRSRTAYVTNDQGSLDRVRVKIAGHWQYGFITNASDDSFDASLGLKFVAFEKGN